MWKAYISITNHLLVIVVDVIVVVVVVVPAGPLYSPSGETKSRGCPWDSCQRTIVGHSTAAGMLLTNISS